MKYARMLEGRYALILGGGAPGTVATAGTVAAAVADLFAAHGARVALACASADTGASAAADILTYERPMVSSQMAGLCDEEFRKDAPGSFFVRCGMSLREDTARCSTSTAARSSRPTASATGDCRRTTRSFGIGTC